MRIHRTEGHGPDGELDRYSVTLEHGEVTSAVESILEALLDAGVLETYRLALAHRVVGTHSDSSGRTYPYL